MAGQTRKRSAIEAVTNVVLGLIVSWTITFLLLPIWGLEPTIVEAFQITLLFTVASLIRLFVVRRGFNWWDNHEIRHSPRLRRRS